MRLMIFYSLAIAFAGTAITIPSHAGVASSSNDASGNELLQPADNRVSAPHQISYKLSNGSENWDADARSRIVKAMNEAVAVYNRNGDFERALTANWNPSTPTADANFGGWINFGGQIGTRTALHEIAHTLGIGTSPKWHEFSVKGIWIGKYGIEQLKALDGPDAVLHCDNQHFWPYGLNYDEEGGEENFKRNVLMVTAMRADLGLGPPPRPAAHTLKVAKADAADAHAQVAKAQIDLSQLRLKLQNGLELRPQVIAASKTVAKTKSAYDAVVAAELKVLSETAGYQAANVQAIAARKKLDELQEDTTATPEDRTAAAQLSMAANRKLTELQNKDLASNSKVSDAKNALNTAVDALRESRESGMKNDPGLLAAKDTLTAALTSAVAADQAVHLAEQAVAKEQAKSAGK